MAKTDLPLPTAVRIGVFDYTIEEWDRKEADVRGFFGETHNDHKVIRVALGWPRQRSAVTLLHEILHAVWGEQSLEVGDSEERIIRATTLGLMQVFRDNPKVKAFICGAV